MSEAEGAAAPQSEADRVNRRFAGVGAAIGLLLWFLLFQIPAIPGFIVAKSHPRLGRFLVFLAMLLVPPFTFWLARSVGKREWRRAFPLARVEPGVLAWTLLWVLAFLAVEFAGLSAIDRIQGLPHQENPFSSVGVLGVVLGAPLAEEVLFRGYGIARIRELGGERRALLFTAAAFALAHMNWIKLPGTFVLGCFAGWLVLRTGSLWPALLAHVTVNAIAAMAMIFLKPAALDGHASWGLILGSAAGGGAVLALLCSPWVRGRIRGLSAPP